MAPVSSSLILAIGVPIAIHGPCKFVTAQTIAITCILFFSELGSWWWRTRNTGASERLRSARNRTGSQPNPQRKLRSVSPLGFPTPAHPHDEIRSLSNRCGLREACAGARRDSRRRGSRASHGNPRRRGLSHAVNHMNCSYAISSLLTISYFKLYCLNSAIYCIICHMHHLLSIVLPSFGTSFRETFEPLSQHFKSSLCIVRMLRTASSVDRCGSVPIRAEKWRQYFFDLNVF